MWGTGSSSHRNSLTQQTQFLSVPLAYVYLCGLIDHMHNLPSFQTPSPHLVSLCVCFTVVVVLVGAEVPFVESGCWGTELHAVTLGGASILSQSVVELK